MTPDEIALAKRLVKCKQWVWEDGMWLIDDRGIKTLLVRTSLDPWLAAQELDPGVRRLDAASAKRCLYFDLNHRSNVGWLLGMVQGVPAAHIRLRGLDLYTITGVALAWRLLEAEKQVG